jgi:hypothetical protein
MRILCRYTLGSGHGFVLNHFTAPQVVIRTAVNASCAVGLYKLNAVDPWLENTWFQPLNLNCDILVSNVACKCNVYATARCRG